MNIEHVKYITLVSSYQKMYALANNCTRCAASVDRLGVCSLFSVPCRNFHYICAVGARASECVNKIFMSLNFEVFSGKII